MPSTFTGITAGSSLYLTKQLEINLVLWLDEAFLNAGMYRKISTSGEIDYVGNYLCQLQSTSDSRYPSGTYWEARTNNWTYESGLAVTDIFRPSGIYLKQPSETSFTFYPIGSSNGDFNYVIDFKRGAIRFLNDFKVSPDCTILCPHTYKEVHVDIADNVNFNQPLLSDTKNEVLGSGLNFPTDGQIQFPAVFIEPTDRRWRPFELGGNKIAIEAVKFHVFAETKSDRDQLCDMLDGLKGKTIRLSDFNSAPLPLDDNGDINYSYPNLDTLQATNYWRTSYFDDVTSEKFKSNVGYFRGTVDCNLEVYSFN